MAASAVLVHGLWHGGWSWGAVQAQLRGQGVDSIAVELPMQTLDGDAAVLTAALDAADGPVILVGHSYGGAVITAAGAHPAVRHLLYIAAFALDVGESISRVRPEISPTELPAAMRFSADGQQVSIDPELARALLYDGSTAASVDAALARLRPVGRALFAGRPVQTAWRARQSTYVLCTEDLAVAPELQRMMAARATNTVEWQTGHTPLLSHPEQVADLVAELVASC